MNSDSLSVILAQQFDLSTLTNNPAWNGHMTHQIAVLQYSESDNECTKILLFKFHHIKLNIYKDIITLFKNFHNISFERLCP